MKTFKRTLAVVLCLLMCVSALAITASAAETIDTNATGSITIHKYEYNGTPGDNGTGEATDAVPDGATPLAGVTFKITKVAELDTYYGVDGKALPTVEEAKAMTPISTEEGTTDENGELVFADLSLGLYLVQEISAPAQITGKTADFLVSIPMTNATEDGWLYDVHVFPKNTSTYASVTLLKQGKTGNAAATALAGATFVLQSKGENNAWTTVTENNKGVAIGTLTTGNDGKITVSDLAPGDYRFVETAVGNGYIMDGATTYNFTINAEGAVVIGNQVVDTTQNPITVINHKPDMDKQVVDGAAQEAGDFSIGDDVPYVITVEVPENIQSLKTFKLTDTMTNQSYNGDLIVEGLSADAYKVTATATGFVVAFDTAKLTAGTLTIRYTAELLTSAVTSTVGNPNSAVLTYSNQILPTTEDGNPNKPGTPTENTITDETAVYTFELKVDKDDESGKPLAGVEFDVYAYTGNVEEPTVAELQANGSVVAHITTDADGLATVVGLENGTYYLVETKTADGYNLLKAPVAVTLNVSYKTTWTETSTYDADGDLVKHEVSEKSEYFGGSASSVGANYVSQTVVNKKGFTLPQTGGLGTLMFILIGGVLMGGGVMLMTSATKKHEQ